MTANTRLLFLPGAGGDPAFWRPLGDLLPGSWEKTYLAWPGLGDQPPSPRVRGFDDLVGLVEERLGDGPVDILAQSMGGPVALRVAMRNPGKIRRLVLAVTSGGIDVAGLGGADWRPAYRRQYPRAAAWVMDARPDYTDLLPQVAHCSGATPIRSARWRSASGSACFSRTRRSVWFREATTPSSTTGRTTSLSGLLPISRDADTLICPRAS